MLTSLINAGRELLIQPQCPICQATISSHTETSKPCKNCRLQLDLPSSGLIGLNPLNWRALGWYDGNLRRLLLNLRRSKKHSTMHALAELLNPLVPINAVLVPIPSWKNLSRANPLPQLLATYLKLPCHSLLIRRHATVGQHHLDRQLRLKNQLDAFKAVPGQINEKIDWSRHRAWIVDDILTTGATAQAAQTTLQTSGIPVGGLVCLARTPLRQLPGTGRPHTVI
ncbi:MAG: ComF family protein [Prochlorococcus sp.]